MWTAPPEGVAYEQWLMDQVAMYSFHAMALHPARDDMTPEDDAKVAWRMARAFMERRRLIDQGVNRAD